jgi:hypothetical protein
MKKILIYISFLLISSGALAQAKIGVDGNVIATGNYPVVNSEHVKGGLHDDIQTIILRNAILPAFRKVGMLVYVVDSSKYYYLKTGITNSDWSELTLGSGGGVSPTNQIQNGIISGGTVTWSGTGLTFDITALIYAKNGIIYTIPAGQVTLDPSDNTYGRIDLILADTVVNSFLKKTGIAGTVPITPQAIPDSQVALTTGILLNAGSVTPPNISTTMVYDENNAPPEWTVSASPSMTYNKDNTVNPFSGTRSILISSYTASYSSIVFSSASTQVVSNDKTLKFRIKLTAPFPSNSNVAIFLYKGNELVAYTGRFTNGFGFRTDNIVDYQNVSIPFSSFPSFADVSFDKIYIEFTNSNPNPFYIDRVEIQDGVPNIIPQTDYSNKIDSVTLVKDTLVTTWIKGVGTVKYVLNGIKYQYTSADSLYHINVYQDGHHDSTQYVGSGVGSGGYYPHDSTVIKVKAPYLSYDLTDSTLKFLPDSLNLFDSLRNNAGILEGRKKGVFVPQFTLPSGGGGVGSFPVNDSIAKGFLISDSGVVNTGLTPMSMTWKKINQQRYFTTIDDNFIDYKSKYEANMTFEDTTISGSTPTVINSNLVVVGNSKMRVSSGPTTAWTTVEMNIQSMNSNGTGNILGPAIIADSLNYIAGVYNSVMGYCSIVVNGTNVFYKAIDLDSSFIKLQLIITGNTVGMWAESNSNRYFIGNYNSASLGLVSDTALARYKYGIVSYSIGGVSTNTVSLLRAGSSGGGGLLNVKVVTNEDGSPYTYSNKVLFTADLQASPNQNSEQGYVDGNSRVFMMDMNTFHIESVGRIFVRRPNNGNPITLGSENIKLTWFSSLKKWLLIYAPWDMQGGPFTYSDVYTWIDYEAPFGSTVIDSSQFNQFGINKATFPGQLYDLSVRKIGDSIYVLGAYKNGGNAYPSIFSGISISSLPIGHQYPTSTFLECGNFMKVQGKWFISYYTFGDTRGIVFDLQLDSLGYMNLPFAASPGINAIPGYELLPYQKNGKTNYYLIGFDSQNLTLNSTEYPWTRGNFSVFRSDQLSIGYEFPNHIANQISFPVKDFNIQRLGKFLLPGQESLTTGPQVIRGNKTFSNTVTFNTFNPSFYNLISGSILLQPTNFNNGFLSDNAYYNGSSWTRLNTGYASGFQFYNGQVIVNNSNTGTGTITWTSPFKTDFSGGGTVALGGTVNTTAAGDFTGATMVINSTNATVSTNLVSPVIYGSSLVGGTLTLSGTSSNTKGKILFGTSSYSEVDNRLGLTTNTPSSTLDLGNYSPYSYTFKSGGFLLQPTSLNNGFLSDNAYYNNISWTRLNTGYASGFQFYNGQVIVNTTNTGTGTITWASPFKADFSNSGTVALGGTVNTTAGDFTGATTVITQTGATIGSGAVSTGDKLEVTGNIALKTAGNKIKITEGTNGSVGQTTLIAGTKAITITGLTVSSRAIVTLVSQGGTVTTTIAYSAVCTSGTLTITALTNAGATDISDTSVLNYFIIN